MSAPPSEQKKRPPPIAIPPLPPSLPVSGSIAPANASSYSRGSGQYAQRLASLSTHQDMRSGKSTPLTSPLEPDESRLALLQSGSQASRHRASAVTTLSSLMGQARSSPRKSGASSMPSRHSSTVRSRQSERSYRSATTAQAQLEALGKDETTTRSHIEARTEKKLFKMTGQIPPTPTTGAINPESVFIRTEDLRAQCRAASGEKTPEVDEPTKSPKKKFFGVSMPTFSRTPAPGVTPDIPKKAAQVLGTTPSRKPRRIEPRPIRSARGLKTPTKGTQSDTTKSLSGEVYGTNSTRISHSCSARDSHTTAPRPPEQENTPPQGYTAASSSFESMPPPTPPAKDTPPEFRIPANPPSPLRRAPSEQDLRERYGDAPNRGTQVQLKFPLFALSPSPPKTAIQGNGGMSPTKFRPYTAEDYTRLIEGEALQWPYPDEDEIHEVKDGGHSAPLATERQEELLQLPQSSRSDGNHYNERLGRRLSPLPPRFYSPSDRSVQLFRDGESPSQNTDTTRMLFAPPKPSLTQLNSNTGSIEMIYQGSMHEGESDFSKTLPTSDEAHTQDKPSTHQHADAELADRVTQELRISEQQHPQASKNAMQGHLKPDLSSSQLTDMLNGASPRNDSNGDFRVLCPSAVPSPLHKLHSPHVPMQPMLRGGLGVPSAGPFASPRTHKTIEDHFFMTNEHLDVVGKTMYDAVDTFTKQQISAAITKHDQLAVIVEEHIEGLKSQISSVDEKADDTSNRTHNVSLKLDQLEKFLQDEVIAVMKEQTKKTAEMESSLREVHKALMHTQQMMEKLSESKVGQQHSATHALPTPSASAHLPHTVPSQHSQPPLTGYFGNANEASRDEHSPMPALQDRSISGNYEAHGDPRGNYGSNWQTQGWNGRSTYQGRGKGDGSSYAGTNPYHFGNGAQYPNSYMSAYSSYNFSPTSSEQPYAYGQKPAQ